MEGTFEVFKKAVENQLSSMQKLKLFRSSVSKDLLWETYLQSYPPGTNPILNERPEYECNTCKHFIRNAGDIVALNNKNELVSVWDITLEEPYQTVTSALSELVHKFSITDFYFHTEPHAGADHSRQLKEDGKIQVWQHFHFATPKSNLLGKDVIGSHLNTLRTHKEVFLRSLTELTMESVDLVLELIGQNSLYRGDENKAAVIEFKKAKTEVDKLKKVEEQERWVWANCQSWPSVSRIRNTAIGTLLIDLSEGKDLDKAVAAFEAKVAPSNYKRPTAPVTKSMIAAAEVKVDELGFTSALERRYAVTEDITINNVLYASRPAKKAMSVFEDLASTTPENLKSLDKVEEINIEKFIKDILPQIDSMEVLVENSHLRSLVSLIAPVDPTSQTMFKWDNNFSWSYLGDLTDSIKEKVKAAGGSVTGDLRCSLAWFNGDDLDLHMHEAPTGIHIYFGNKLSKVTKGTLDVDMNAGGATTRTPVENITYPDRKLMKDGKYELFVNQFHKRENIDLGFEIEIEVDGNVHYFSYGPAVTGNVGVADIHYSKKDGFKIVPLLKSDTKRPSKVEWGITTQTFVPVNLLMNSPNHWDDKVVGNKHYFFMLEGCVNPEATRGFYNEFLTDKLSDHRKVFEIIGSKLKAPFSDRQLSGIGFSSTQRNHVFCRVKGSFARTLKITF